ncbi:MAG: hypothetical protein ACSLEL_04345 [Candidatus Malihini olakiniferum]
MPPQAESLVTVDIKKVIIVVLIVLETQRELVLINLHKPTFD